MNDLSKFLLPLKQFQSATASYKIEVFGWYLHEKCLKDRFTAIDLSACFDELHVQRPANIHGLLSALCDRKPARLLKDSKGYRLSAIVREELIKILPTRPIEVVTTKLLASLANQVTNSSQQRFLNETLICYSHGAYRAAIVMAWNLAYSHVCDMIFANHLMTFNAQLNKILPKSSPISKRSDFDDYKEGKVIEAARGANILSAASAKILKEKLDKRNTAAHPSSIKVTSITAEEVIHDLVENIVLRPEL